MWCVAIALRGDRFAWRRDAQVVDTVERVNRAPVEITCADEERLGVLASVFARSFVDDPMMGWSLMTGESEGVLDRCFTYFLEVALGLGLVWEAVPAMGAAVWIPPGRCDTGEEHPWNQSRILELSDDGGARYESFWSWVDLHIPDEPLWLLDSIAVDPKFQGQGNGRALVEAGQSLAADAGRGAILSTATQRNLSIYGNCGFRVVDHADAPDGGPHVWFMRWDP
jgi:GNAT superfamily N-acetyltransferase